VRGALCPFARAKVDVASEGGATLGTGSNHAEVSAAASSTAAKEEAPTVCQYGAAAAAAAAAAVAASPPETRVSTEEAEDVPAPAVGGASCLSG